MLDTSDKNNLDNLKEYQNKRGMELEDDEAKEIFYLMNEEQIINF